MSDQTDATRIAEIRERLYPTRAGYCAEPLDVDEARFLLDQLTASADALAEARQELQTRREQWTEHESPFHEWAQSYLDSARWAGHDRADAIKVELLERDADLASLRAEHETLRKALRTEMIGHRDRRHHGLFEDRCIRCIHFAALLASPQEPH
jgi:hypothetical protein